MSNSKLTVAAKTLEKAERKYAKVVASSDSALKKALDKASAKAQTKQTTKIEAAKAAVDEATKGVQEALAS